MIDISVIQNRQNPVMQRIDDTGVSIVVERDIRGDVQEVSDATQRPVRRSVELLRFAVVFVFSPLFRDVDGDIVCVVRDEPV